MNRESCNSYEDREELGNQGKVRDQESPVSWYTYPSLFFIKKSPVSLGWASLVAQLVKNLPAKQETWVQCLGWEDPLEKGKAT